MTGNTIGSLFTGLALLLLGAAPAAPAPPVAADPQTPTEERHSAPRVDVGEAPLLGAGEDLVLGREDGSGLVLGPGDDPVIRFVEVEGAKVVVRLTPIDREGGDLGSGRVIVVGASEQREVRLRDEFVREALYGAQLRIEALQGLGRLVLTTIEENGRGLQAQADPSRSRRRPARRVSTPTSFALIDQAETSGALDSETALLYRVYALFSDARLPAQYRGDDSRIEDSLYMAEARERFATLSPATQDALQPFLVPPVYAGSWANPAASSVSPLATPPSCDSFSDKWGFVETSNNLVRIWYRLDLPGDAVQAVSLIDTIDTIIWPKLSGLMPNHLPLSDLGQTCNGGNGRLDIYISDVARSKAIPYSGCKQSPVFILLQRNADILVPHEIFHAFQFSFPLNGCITAAKYRWWAEASAQWAEDFVFPKDQHEQNKAPSLLGVPEQPLDLINDDHEYGAYLLPFFVHRKTGNADFVRVAWEKCASQPALEALDQAMAGGFEAVWPEFARANWNRWADWNPKPIEDYVTWDKLHDQAKPAGGASLHVSLAGRMDAEQELTVDLPRLSATYKYFKFPDDTTRTVAFWNGVTSKLSLKDIPAIGVQYQPDPATDDEKKGARVQALIKLKGQEWQVADWTNLPYVTFCRDMLAERIDELVLIISNSEFKDRERKLKPPDMAPVLWASNMGCWQWKGTATLNAVSPDGSGMRISTNATWTRPDASQGPPFVLYKAEGTQNWSISGACSGSGTLPILPEFSFLFTYNFTPSQGSFHRTYAGQAADPRLVPVVCRDAGSLQVGLLAWLSFPVQPLLPGIPGTRFVRVNADGRVMDDSHTMIGGGQEWKWHFEAQREP